MSNKQSKICVVSCSVLKDEIKQLIKQGDLDVEPFSSASTSTLTTIKSRRTSAEFLKTTLRKFQGNVVLVYGDLCLDMDNEMKQLAEEYGIVKVDALNCIDCQLGGKGKFLKADPNHDLMFLSPGMTEFFSHMKTAMRRENIDEDQLKQLFSWAPRNRVVGHVGKT